MRRIPPLNWLYSFEAAARHLSFTAAARELNITQSAVSQQIRLLENYLGEPLFIRNRRSLALTEAANRYYPAIHQSFERIERSSSVFAIDEPKRLISISSNISFLNCWLLRRIGDFEAHYPHMALRLSTTRWSTDPKNSGTSIEIIYGDGNWAMPAEQLTHMLRFPVCSPALAAAIRKPSDMESHNLITNIGEDNLWTEWGRQAGVKLLEERQKYSVDLQWTAMQLAVQGKGIAMANWIIAADLLESGALRVPIRKALPGIDNYYISYRENTRRVVEIGDFSNWLRRLLAEEESRMRAYFLPKRPRRK